MSTNHNTAKMIKKGIECTLSLPVEMTQSIAITAPDRCFHRFRCLTLHDFHGLTYSKHGAGHFIFTEVTKRKFAAAAKTSTLSSFPLPSPPVHCRQQLAGSLWRLAIRDPVQ